MKSLFVCAMLPVLGALLMGADDASTAPPWAPKFESERAEPGLAYGKSEALPLPKTILFSASPDEIIADAEEWSRRGINAFFVDYTARDWSSDIWACDGKPWTIGAADETFQKVKKAAEICRRIGSDTLLKIAFDNPIDWFNDTLWQQLDHNFRQFAIFARDTGCTGVALDIEYIGKQYSFLWDGYSYNGYTRKDLVEKIRLGMTQAIAGMYDEFPNMVFATFPECGFSLGSVIHTAWIEEAARRDAPGGVHYCTEGTYRNPNIRYMFAHAWVCNEVFKRLLSERAWKYWETKCSISEGVWPFGFDYKNVLDPGMPLDEFRQGYAASLMASRRYNWIYSHNARELIIGRALDKYTGKADIKAYLKALADKEIVTSPKYVQLAREIRDTRVRDYSKDLGVIPAVSFAGPDDVPGLQAAPVGACDLEALAPGWDLALRYYKGDDVNLHDLFGTQTNWMVIGPFENGEGFTGHRAVYPPEQMIDLNAEYDGLKDKVRWIECRQAGSHASVDFTKIFKPTEHVTAYALCYVTSPKERQVQIRLGTNDAGKLWIGGKLVFDYPKEGTASLDRDIIPVTLPAGTTPILLKVSNGINNWGFVFRITDLEGRALKDLEYTLKPPR